MGLWSIFLLSCGYGDHLSHFTKYRIYASLSGDNVDGGSLKK